MHYAAIHYVLCCNYDITALKQWAPCERILSLLSANDNLHQCMHDNGVDCELDNSN